ncbi:MAG: hypothetical protein WCO78_04185 [Candidatus Roizmanbacteria bacterium]
MNKQILLYIVLALIFVSALLGGAFYLGRTTSTQSTDTTAAPITTATTPGVSPQTGTQSPTISQQTQSSLFTGKVAKLPNDLNLFKVTESDIANGVTDSFAYFSAGTYAKGEYAGYTRIIAIRPSEGPGPSLQYVLATKDFKSYLLDDPKSNTTLYDEASWENPYMHIDKSKISKAVTLESDHPQTIATGEPFGLIRYDNILTELKPSGKKDKNGYDISLDYLITEVDTSHVLTSSQKQLTLYASSTEWTGNKNDSDKEKNLLAIRNQYLKTTTYVLAADSTGLTYPYVFSPQSIIGAYQKDLPTYDQSYAEYTKQVAEYEQKKIGAYPKAPQYINFPSMQLTKALAGLPSDYYNTYDMAFPGACGGGRSTYVVDGLKNDDLIAISSSSSFTLYILTDSNHPLYQLAYNAKSGYDEESFKMSNDNMPRPSISEYVSKHPLLFFKDTWDRWVVIGEYDIKLMGGCGKPVVYLYPEKPTTVRISFVSPVTLDTQIPTYHDGWLVKAQPDGTITDLQPQYTDCSLINSSRFGSEYASDACRKNEYPYIYWSGKSIENAYPSVKGGWIVTKDNLESFMNARMSEMGLTAKESADMISYWVPKMSEKNTPYYRVSFFQTKEMNEFIPMDVSPRPDTVIRVFLDYSALNSKPVQEITPQKLQYIERTGFTLVEWGGLR